MLDEKLHYISILSIENDIAKSLSYEEAIRCVRQMINIHIFLNLVMYVVFVGFLKFVKCCDFFSHSK